jgi:predicted nucleic acid-binding protein
MSFATIPAGTAVFVDANVLIYHLTSHPLLGSACTDLIKRVEQGTIDGLPPHTS